MAITAEDYPAVISGRMSGERVAIAASWLGRLRTLLPFTPAAVLSALAFMAHHVVLLYVYLPKYFFVAAVPFSLCIAVGGFFWAWLYERTGTIYSAWVSHGIVDAALFALGWVLMQRLNG